MHKLSILNTYTHKTISLNIVIFVLLCEFTRSFHIVSFFAGSDSVFMVYWTFVYLQESSSIFVGLPVYIYRESFAIFVGYPCILVFEGICAILVGTSGESVYLWGIGAIFVGYWWIFAGNRCYICGVLVDICRKSVLYKWVPVYI